MNTADKKSIDAIKILSADAIEKAKSGHPGLPLGASPMAYELWAHHMKHNPADPEWINRDRFILSGGHGSMLLYSLLHLFNYGGQRNIEEIKQFRQLGSLTPGHPEFGHTIGVEASTGPLGAGMAMATGMAIAERHLASIFNKEDFPVIDHYTYVLGGDGCMMEGTSYEAFSLAGTLGLGKLIVLYDSNDISIEGGTNIAFRENVLKRFESFGFQTLLVEDGTDLDAIGKAIEEAKAETSRPSVIQIKTRIGAGCPAKEGKASAHGEPLGEDNVKELRKNIGWEYDEPFFVPDDIYDHFDRMSEELGREEDKWNALFDEYVTRFPEMKELWDRYFSPDTEALLKNDEAFWNLSDKSEATRSISGKAINEIKRLLPGFFGGSADLAPSTKTYMNGAGDFSKEDPSGSNMHFGVREIAMGGISNGIALHGGLTAFCGTFFVFSDYLKPMARLACLMKLPVTYVLTHDSIGVGEDGPTHQPVEQLAMFRSMPGINTWRPADAAEVSAAWYAAVTSKEGPNAIVLSRQNLPQLTSDTEGALRGGYTVKASAKDIPDGIIIASGSELSLAVKAADILLEEGIDVNVVSMPCMEIFDRQTPEYKESVLPSNVTKRVSVEALSTFGWERYTGIGGANIGMKTFGASAPGNVLFEHYGITADAVTKAFKAL